MNTKFYKFIREYSKLRFQNTMLHTIKNKFAQYVLKELVSCSTDEKNVKGSMIRSIVYLFALPIIYFEMKFQELRKNFDQL